MSKFKNGDIIFQMLKADPTPGHSDKFDQVIWTAQKLTQKGSEASRTIHVMLALERISPSDPYRVIEATNESGVTNQKTTTHFDTTNFVYRAFRCKRDIGNRVVVIAERFLGNQYEMKGVIFSPIFKKNFGEKAKEYINTVATKTFEYNTHKTFDHSKNKQGYVNLLDFKSKSVKESMFCSKLAVTCYQLALVTELTGDDGKIRKEDFAEMDKLMPLDATNCSPGSLFLFLKSSPDFWEEISV